MGMAVAMKLEHTQKMLFQYQLYTKTKDYIYIYKLVDSDPIAAREINMMS